VDARAALVAVLGAHHPVAHHHGPDLLGWTATVAVVVLGCGLHLVVTRAYRARRGRGWSRWRTTSWFVGTAAVAVAIAPVWHSVDAEVTAHVQRHLLLGMLAPVALVAGAPVTLLLGATPAGTGRAVSRVLRHRVVHLLGHPAVAAVPAVGGMYVLHLTPLYTASTEHAVLHHLVQLHLLLAGYLFTWSLVGPDPAPRRPGLGVRVAVLVVSAAAHGYLAKVLYAGADGLPPGGGHDLRDVQAAAQWLYYGGDAVEVLLACLLLGGWYRRRARRRLGAGPPAGSLPVGTVRRR
jgi:putative membrane protein